MTEQPLTDNNMAVIRETNACVLSRHDLQNERRKILNMDFETDSRMWNKMKRRQLQQKQEQSHVQGERIVNLRKNDSATSTPTE